MGGDIGVEPREELAIVDVVGEEKARDCGGVGGVVGESEPRAVALTAAAPSGGTHGSILGFEFPRSSLLFSTMNDAYDFKAIAQYYSVLELRRPYSGALY